MQFIVSKYTIVNVINDVVILYSLLSREGMKMKKLAYDLIRTGELNIIPDTLLNKLIAYKFIVPVTEHENESFLNESILIAKDTLSTYFISLDNDETHISPSIIEEYKQYVNYLGIDINANNNFIFLINTIKDSEKSIVIKNELLNHMRANFSYIFTYADLNSDYKICNQQFTNASAFYFIVNCSQLKNFRTSLLSILQTLESNTYSVSLSGTHAILLLYVSEDYFKEDFDLELLLHIQNFCDKVGLSFSLYITPLFQNLSQNTKLYNNFKKKGVRIVTLPNKKFTQTVNVSDSYILKNQKSEINKISSSDLWDITDLILENGTVIVNSVLATEDNICILRQNQCYTCSYLPACGGMNRKGNWEKEECPENINQLNATLSEIFI